MSFILSTRNPKKVEELRAVLREIGYELISLEDFEHKCKITIPEVEETADTFYGNAFLKAETALTLIKDFLAQNSLSHDGDLGVIADDSGLVVPLLNGEPGIHSARYAGVDGDSRSVHRANIDKLHQKLRAHSQYQGETPAYFITIIVLLQPNASGGKNTVIVGEGRCEGRIIDDLRGENGFGYDPIFIPEEGGNNLTFAEMNPEKKNQISHRSRAIHHLVNQLSVVIDEND